MLALKGELAKKILSDNEGNKELKRAIKLLDTQDSVVIHLSTGERYRIFTERAIK